jgi:hypothetical protein
MIVRRWYLKILVKNKVKEFNLYQLIELVDIGKYGQFVIVNYLKFKVMIMEMQKKEINSIKKNMF